MATIVHVLVSGSPFVQWGSVGLSDLAYLTPWLLLIWLLVPKGGSESSNLRMPWTSVLMAGVVVITVAFLALVAFYVVAG